MPTLSPSTEPTNSPTEAPTLTTTPTEAPTEEPSVYPTTTLPLTPAPTYVCSPQNANNLIYSVIVLCVFYGVFTLISVGVYRMLISNLTTWVIDMDRKEKKKSKNTLYTRKQFYQVRPVLNEFILS
jgi:hypothetical protein